LKKGEFSTQGSQSWRNEKPKRKKKKGKPDTREKRIAVARENRQRRSKRKGLGGKVANRTFGEKKGGNGT